MKSVFFDVDTQIDFMFPAGALYVPGAEQLIPTIARLNAFAGSTGSQLVSTMDAHTEDDEEFHRWPAHCVVGTVGQLKPAATILDKPLVVPPYEWAGRIDHVRQIIIEKRHNDCFTNPNLAGMLDAFEAERYVVYGVVTEICVQYAALGLLDRGRRVEIVRDAVRELSEAAARSMFAEFTARGGAITTSEQVVS
jgi:nicotinamidase/pyrazinamidase